MYKDKDKQKEANKERQRRYRDKQKGVTSEGVTEKALQRRRYLALLEVKARLLNSRIVGLYQRASANLIASAGTARTTELQVPTSLSITVHTSPPVS